MDYKMKISDNDTNIYLDKLIDKIFAILGIYEDCVDKGSFDDYFVYLDRLCVELKGCSYTFDVDKFISLYNILIGLMHSQSIEHKQVKSIVFHCISVVKKMKVV